jgi:hypothetical protein
VIPAPRDATHDGQLAARAAELLPGIGSAERLELLGVMDPDDLRSSLAFIISQHPAVFDASLARDRKLVERLTDRLGRAGSAEDDLEPYCARCGADIGIFWGHGEGWHHYRTGTDDCSVSGTGIEIYVPDDEHAPAVSWAPAGER